MERRRHPRIAVNLNVALLDDSAMPRGCRVRDVSQGGMLLQFEHIGSEPPYESGKTIKVRASLKEGDQRRTLVLPATVRRVEDRGIAVAFARPESELMQLLEPYRLDRGEAAPQPALQAGREQAAAGGGVHLFAPARPRHRDHSPSGGARLAERIAAARNAIASAGHLHATPPPAAAATAGNAADRRVLHLGVAALAIAVAVVIFDLAASASLRQRIAALETSAQRQAETLADVQIRLTADRDHERLTSLDHRVDELAVSVAALETGKLSPAVDGPSEAGPAAGTRAAAQPTPPGPAEKTPAAARTAQDSRKPTPAAAPPVSGGADTPWVVNLVSLYDQAAAERFSRRAREQGIEVTENRTQVQGRPVWRLQVDGFATREAAVAYSEANKGKLGLKKVWIFKR